MPTHHHSSFLDKLKQKTHFTQYEATEIEAKADAIEQVMISRLSADKHISESKKNEIIQK